MRIETYFLSEKKKLSLGDAPTLLFEIMYQTIFPVAGVWLFFETKWLFFLSFMVIPVFFRIRLTPKKIYRKEMQNWKRRAG